MTLFRSLLVAFALGSFVSALSAQEWTRFHGPNGNGQNDTQTVPVKFTEADYNWKAELPGVGHSSPVLWGNKLFVTSGDPDTGDLMVFGFDAETGKQLWDTRFKSKVYHLHNRNSFASSTPAADEQHVYIAWASPDDFHLAALTHDGKPVWEEHLGSYSSSHGFGASPVVYEGMVIMGNEQKGNSSLNAYDCKTGGTRWKVARKTSNTSYASPCVYQPAGGKPELIFSSQAHGLSSLDPKTGETNWELPVFDKRTVSSPFVIGDLVFGACGSGGGGNYVAAVRPGVKDGQPAELAYKVTKSAPYVPTSVALGALAFLWSDKGVVSCIDAKTGEEHWQKRVQGNYSGSPVRAGKCVYCISEDGEVVVIAASREFEEISRNPLGDPSRSTPAVANGHMFLRTYKYLISIGGK